MLETEYHNLRIFCLRAERKTQSSNVLKREQEVKQSVNTQQKNLEKKNNYCTLNRGCHDGWRGFNGITLGHNNFLFFKTLFLGPQVEVAPFTPEILQYHTMILQRPRIIVGDSYAGLLPQKSGALYQMSHSISSNEPPHLPKWATTSPQMSHLIYNNYCGYCIRPRS